MSLARDGLQLVGLASEHRSKFRVACRHLPIESSRIRSDLVDSVVIRSMQPHESEIKFSYCSLARERRIINEQTMKRRSLFDENALNEAPDSSIDRKFGSEPEIRRPKVPFAEVLPESLF